MDEQYMFVRNRAGIIIGFTGVKIDRMCHPIQRGIPCLLRP